MHDGCVAQSVSEMINSLGSNYIMIMPGAATQGGARIFTGQSTLTEEDAARFSFLLSAPFFLVFLGVPSFWLVAFALVVSSIIWWVGVPSEHPILCDIVPAEYRASAIGILNMCGSAAGGLGVLLAGALKKDYGLGALFGASSLLFVIAGSVTLFAYAFLLSRDVERARQHATARLHERVAIAV